MRYYRTMKHILVTGGAGFLGSHTVVALAAAGYQPVIVDTLENSEQSVLDRLAELTGSDIPFYKQDVAESAGLRDILAKESITGIIHFAAYKAVADSIQRPLRYYENNVAAFIALLATCEAIGSVENIVFSSSATVYGETSDLPIVESAPVKPATSAYGASKQMCETSVSAGFNAMSLRYFNPIGAHPSAKIGELPRGVPANLVPYVTQAAAGIRDRLVVYGNDYPTPDGSCIRDYIHVQDLARAHVAALRWLEQQPKQVSEVCNIGTGTGTSVLEVLKTFETVTGVAVPYIIGPRRPGDTVQSYASVDKAAKLLGWHAELDVAAALRDAWRWQQVLGSNIGNGS
jgi:UDP-glucose 4-epimerase